MHFNQHKSALLFDTNEFNAVKETLYINILIFTRVYTATKLVQRPSCKLHASSMLNYRKIAGYQIYLAMKPREGTRQAFRRSIGLWGTTRNKTRERSCLIELRSIAAIKFVTKVFYSEEKGEVIRVVY